MWFPSVVWVLITDSCFCITQSKLDFQFKILKRAYLCIFDDRALFFPPVVVQHGSLQSLQHCHNQSVEAGDEKTHPLLKMSGIGFICFLWPWSSMGHTHCKHTFVKWCINVCFFRRGGTSSLLSSSSSSSSSSWSVWNSNVVQYLHLVSSVSSTCVIMQEHQTG